MLLKGLPSAAGSAAGLQSGLEKSGCAWAAAVDVAGLADALVEESRLEVVLRLSTGKEKGSGLLLGQWGSLLEVGLNKGCWRLGVDLGGVR